MQPASSDQPNVLAVAAADRFDQKGDFSNFGRFTVEVAAPGKEVLTTKVGDAYGTCSRISCATPHVAAALALVRERFPRAAAVQLKSRVVHASEPVGSLNGFVASGARLDLHRALSGSASIASVGLDDSDPNLGNGDGHLDLGETAVLAIEVDILASWGVWSVEVIAVAPPAGVRILDGHARLESIGPASRAVASLPISFSLDGAAPCGGPVTSEAEIRTAGEAPVRNVWSLPVGRDVVSVLLDDRFETDEGWTSPPPTATDGNWERVDPIGAFGPFGPAQPEDDVGEDPDVACQVTENGRRSGGPGEADVDGGSVFLQSPEFGEAGSRSMGMVWYRWLHSDTALADDWFDMSLTADGGASWRRVARVADSSVVLGSWAVAVSNLAAVLSGASTASLKLQAEVRVGAADSGTVEGGLDEVTVRSLREECSPFSPPSRRPPNGVGDTLLLSKLGPHVRLDWQAPPPDADHDAAALYRVRTSSDAGGGFAEAGTSTDTVHVEADGLLSAQAITFYLVESA